MTLTVLTGPIIYSNSQEKIQVQCIAIAPGKALFLNQKVTLFYLFLLENICCGYSLEVPQQGTSNEYP